MTQEIIKFLTAGNVDDGKSTLIGRLLYDTNSLYQDQIEEVTKSTDASFKGGDLDFSLFLDGLTSERSQRITIDAAYRYFSHNEQKFIIADAPGHEQYTRNMAVAASNSNIAIILIDALKGIKTQTIRHSYISNLFGIKNIVVAVNKMDLVNNDQKVFDKIKREYLQKVKSLDFDNIYFVPIIALTGDNIVKKSDNIEWYKGKSIIDYLLTIKEKTSDKAITRFQVQNVIKDDRKRYYQGLLSSGILNVGDGVSAYPLRKNATITEIIHSSKDKQTAYSNNSILIRLDKDIDLDRGGLISDFANKPQLSNQFNCNLLWFSEESFAKGNSSEYFIKLNHNYTRARIDDIHYHINVENLQKDTNIESIQQNQIANIDISLSEPLAFDDFKTNRKTGSFLLIDKSSNETIACGIINKVSNSKNGKNTNSGFFSELCSLFKKYFIK
jgi:sulfate adenylyltransferase large subunit